MLCNVWQAYFLKKKLKEKLNEPQFIDTLESFSAKFSRMQDTIADKLLPVFLKTVESRQEQLLKTLTV